jgi:hypothetical protein
VSSAVVGSAGTGVTQLRLSAFSELKEFHGRDSSEEKARTWLNRVKSASRRDGMTGDEVCALFGDLMAGPVRQWYLQLTRNVKKSWSDLMEQFRIQYCGKGVSMASRYYHATKRPDETPLEYLYRINVAGMRAGIGYGYCSAVEKREHVELFINTLGSSEQELSSRLALMEVPDAATLEKKLRARQRGLAQQKKALFGSNKFRQKTTTPSQPARAIHAIQAEAEEYDSGSEADDSDDQMYDQDRDEEDRARLMAAGSAGEPVRRNPDAGDPGRDRPRCCQCGSRRHLEDDCWGQLTCKKCGGRQVLASLQGLWRNSRCWRMPDGGVLQSAASMVRPAETRGDAAAHSRKDVKLDRSLVWKPVRDERSVSVYAYVAQNAQVSVSESPATLNDNTCGSKLERTSPERSPKVSAVQLVDEYAREEPVGVLDLQPGERRGYWK